MVYGCSSSKDVEVSELPHERSATKAIHLTYKPDRDDPTNVGTLWLSQANGAVPTEIRWADGAAALQARSATNSFLSVLALPVFAAAIEGPPLFRSDGSYDADMARALQFQLGSADLRTRLSARQALVAHGSRAFRFIIDTLDGKTATKGGDRATLVDSLDKAIDEIELKGSRFPWSGHLKLAVALYKADNFKSAASHFDKVDEAGGSYDAHVLAMRSRAYLESERYVIGVDQRDRLYSDDSEVCHIEQTPQLRTC